VVGVEDRLAHTAPRRAAFAAAVVATLATLAPAPARAAALSTWLAAGAAVATLAAGAVSYGTWTDLRADLPPIAASPIVLADRTDQGMTPPADEIPDHVVHAFLAAEDARFFEHGALDQLGIGRAALHNLIGDGGWQGGSTLTQQLAKRMLAEPDRSVRRKVSEVVLAVELERQLTKDEILDRYLDGVYLGAGTRGVRDAARVYFGKPVSELGLAEAALLAGLPQNPQGNSPFHDPARAERRRSYVLDQMVSNGWATPAEVAAAEATPLPTR
jgi:penicillin-binding protein 1A